MTDQPITVEPGPTTTEFWTTVGTGVLTLIVELGTLFDHRFNLSGAQALIPALAPVAAALTAAAYSFSRGKVKVAAHTASAQVLIARAGTGSGSGSGSGSETQPQGELESSPAAGPEVRLPPVPPPLPGPSTAPRPPTTTGGAAPSSPYGAGDETIQLEPRTSTEVWSDSDRPDEPSDGNARRWQ